MYYPGVFKDTASLHATKYLYHQQLYGRQDGKCRFDENRLCKYITIPAHSGCVNTISWDSEGRRLLSGSDDSQLIISDPFAEHPNQIKQTIQSGHRGNIFSAKFLPQGDTVVSCAVDGSVIVTELNDGSPRRDVYNCHRGGTYEVATIADDPKTFLCCGDDGAVRWIDRRERPNCDKLCQNDVIIKCQRPINAIDVHQFRTHLLAIGCSDSTVRLYDLRRLSKANGDETGVLGMQSFFVSPSNRLQHVTSVEFSPIPGDDHILASLISDDVYCFSLQVFASENEKTDMSEMLANGDATSFKKIRLRGDWSDTGPCSRPASSVEPGAAAAAAATTNGQNDDGGPMSQERRRQRLSNALSNILTMFADRINNDSETATTSDTPARQRAQTRLEEARQRRLAKRAQMTDPLKNFMQHKMIQSYGGHRNARTVLKQAAFWGPDLIVSGSDCGHFFIWCRKTGRLLNAIEADRRVVNCVAPHPSFPVLATSGIDYDIKLWAPLEMEPIDRTDEIKDLTERNRVMLEESRGTVTIPATFMLQMFVAMNQ